MIDTPRLLIRHFQQQDDTPLFEYLSDPVVYRFEPGGPISLEEARQLALERAQGTDFWAVVLKGTQKMVGHLYFKPIEPEEFLTWELGYIFNPAFHRNGYATEAAFALIHYGFRNIRSWRPVNLRVSSNVCLSRWGLNSTSKQIRQRFGRHKARL